MATPNYAPPSQEMPPPGGFKPYRYTRGVPTTRGPPGWSLILGTFLLTSYGYYRVGQANKARRALERDERERRICMLPFLQAEADVEFLREHERVLEEERKIMKDVPGWVVGESTYHSDRYTTPLYAQKK
jgi:NADH dehydrogenase (ubiquinone) 1 alpha subcomplex subunit 13